MSAVRALNNANINSTMINALESILSSVLPARATSVTVILMHNVHMDEDWSLVREYSIDTDTTTNALNSVTNNNNLIVLSDINIARLSISLKEIILQLFESNRN
ncbi:436_t:CDS:1 [Funneliformis caledonium]|uniref:436_t:CDS:1 n=1 Tax=Funneliformis caledonium TaxID=1117310 RepID=A0A9N9F763_9GLOM|nr:436_t:CDS:1 [Funneliformis caledonium]